MEFVQYRTGADDEGRRLDKVLRILFPDVPLSNLYNCLRKGLIRINEKKVKQDYRILKDDVIFVADFLDFCTSSKKTCKQNDYSDKDIQCIFKNEHIIVLNKPYDIPVHQTGSYKGMTLNQYVSDRYPSNGDSLSFKPGPLHRLDRKTTGLIAFSQSIKGAHEFTELLKKHEIKKHYLSVVEGAVPENCTFIDYISKENTSVNDAFNTVRVTHDIHETGLEDSGKEDFKQAITTIRPLAYGEVKGKKITFSDISIETGRTHQIRSQCAAHGFPLFGDTAYGGTRADGIFLHAYMLELLLPNALGLPDSLFAPLPERFRHFVENYLPTADLSPYN